MLSGRRQREAQNPMTATMMKRTTRTVRATQLTSVIGSPPPESR